MLIDLFPGCVGVVQAFISTCGDADELFSSQTECVANAGALIQGKSGATGGDTLSCREYHLGVAMVSDEYRNKKIKLQK